jgi:hypothetical protein
MKAPTVSTMMTNQITADAPASSNIVDAATASPGTVRPTIRPLAQKVKARTNVPSTLTIASTPVPNTDSPTDIANPDGDYDGSSSSSSSSATSDSSASSSHHSRHSKKKKQSNNKKRTSSKKHTKEESDLRRSATLVKELSKNVLELVLNMISKCNNVKVKMSRLVSTTGRMITLLDLWV